MIRETPTDPAGPSLEEAIRAASLADHAWGPMDAGEAAQFLKTSDDSFRHLAPSLPRHKKDGLGWRYLRSELLAWLRSEDETAGQPRPAATATHDGSQPVTKRRRGAPKRGVERLV